MAASSSYGIVTQHQPVVSDSGASHGCQEVECLLHSLKSLGLVLYSVPACPLCHGVMLAVDRRTRSSLAFQHCSIGGQWLGVWIHGQLHVSCYFSHCHQSVDPHEQLASQLASYAVRLPWLAGGDWNQSHAHAILPLALSDRSVGSPRRVGNGEISPRGCSRGDSLVCLSPKSGQNMIGPKRVRRQGFGGVGVGGVGPAGMAL